MVDASVGGKVGVDLPEGKNLVGAFYQPKVIVIDTWGECCKEKSRFAAGRDGARRCFPTIRTSPMLGYPYMTT